MIGEIIKFFYFDLGFKLRYLFWKTIINSWGGKIGKAVMIYEGVRIVSANFGSINIGNNVRICRNATIATSDCGKIFIGNNVHIGENTIIRSGFEVAIQDNVIIGPQNIIVDFDHNFEDPDTPIIQQGHNAKKILIEEDVWISSHCNVIKGVVIGKGSVVGAGSVVNKEIPCYSVAVGAPARVIKKRRDRSV